jgi:hypothetical protein
MVFAASPPALRFVMLARPLTPERIVGSAVPSSLALTLARFARSWVMVFVGYQVCVMGMALAKRTQVRNVVPLPV